MRQQRECSQRTGDRAGGIHRLDQAVGGADARSVHRLSNHHIARRAAHAFREAVNEANDEHMPPRRGDGEDWLDQVGDEVSGNHDWFAAWEAVGEISGKELGK